MKHCIWLSIYLTLFITATLCRKIPKRSCVDYEDYSTSDVCYPGGGGFEKWRCRRTNGDEYKWISYKNISCPILKPSCQCFYGPGDPITKKCECYNPAPPPSFPPTGIIRWTGRQRYDSHYYVGQGRGRYLQVQGEVHKMKNGQFLLNRTVVGHWNYFDHNQIPDVEILFEIYVPDGDKGFIKYEGSHGNKKCTMQKVTYSKDLSSIWDKTPYEMRKVYTLYDTLSKKGSISKQRWMRYHEVEDGNWRWMWKVNYDSEKMYAIPIQYRYQAYDWSNAKLWQKTYGYKYEPINGDDESFQLEDFCSNVDK